MATSQLKPWQLRYLTKKNMATSQLNLDSLNAGRRSNSEANRRNLFCFSKRRKSRRAKMGLPNLRRVVPFFWPEPVAFRRVYGTWDLLVYHVTIAAPYPGGIDPRLAVYARSWDGHYTTTRLVFSVQRQMALARSFIKPERQLHFANSPN